MTTPQEVQAFVAKAKQTIAVEKKARATAEARVDQLSRQVSMLRGELEAIRDKPPTPPGLSEAPVIEMPPFIRTRLHSPFSDGFWFSLGLVAAFAVLSLLFAVIWVVLLIAGSTAATPHVYKLF